MNNHEGNDKKNWADEQKDNREKGCIWSNCHEDKCNWKQKILDKLKKFKNHIAYSNVMALTTLGILFVTTHYAYYAKIQAETSSQTLHSIEDHFKLDQRAWLTIQTIQFRNEFKANESNFIDIRIKNTGKTPALKVKMSNSKIYIKDKQQQKLVINSVIPLGEGAYGPNSEYKTSLKVVPFNQDQIDGIKSKDIFLIFTLIIDYIDIFNNKKINHTKACGFFNITSKKEFQLCESGNDMD